MALFQFTYAQFEVVGGTACNENHKRKPCRALSRFTFRNTSLDVEHEEQDAAKTHNESSNNEAT
jgi:hypothetical protein